MTWKPSEGLRLAEPVVQTLIENAATVGVYLTDPALRFRMVEVIAKALDEALEAGSAHALNPPLPLTKGEVPNGEWTFTPSMQNVAPVSISGVSAGTAPTETVSAPKKQRGRPKGSKKAKAVKPAAEAVAS